MRSELANVVRRLLQVVLQVGEHGAYLLCELIDASGQALLKRSELLVHRCKESCRGGFWFPLRVRQMEINLALFRDRDELLFRDIFPPRIGGISQLRCVGGCSSLRRRRSQRQRFSIVT